MRNLLFISYFFPPHAPSDVSRSAAFAQYLPELDWMPFVLTSEPTLPQALDSSMLPDTEDFRLVQTPASDITRFFRKKNGPAQFLPARWQEKMYERLARMMYSPDSRKGWMKNALLFGRQTMRENKIELILATAPPFTDFLIAKELATEFDVPFIVDYRKPLTASRGLSWEKDVLNYAAKVIVTTRIDKENLLRRYGFLSHRDVAIIPHGFDDQLFAREQDQAQFMKNREKFVLHHSGLFHGDASPKKFLDAVKLACDQLPWLKEVLVVQFAGVLRKPHAKLIKKHSVSSSCEILGFLPKAAAVRALLASDVLWFASGSSHHLPGKIGEYIGAGKPIIGLGDADLEKIVQYELKPILKDSIATVDYKNAKKIASVIVEMAERWKSASLPLPASESIRQFGYEHLIKDLSREMGLSLRVL